MQSILKAATQTLLNEKQIICKHLTAIQLYAQTKFHG